MLEKATAKLIKSLEYKKYRKRHNLFVAEGPKAVGDLMKRITPAKVFATHEWKRPEWPVADIVDVTDSELSKISFLQHPQQVLGLFPLPQERDASKLDPQNELILALDGIQDPGNLGTIIRLADWFGIETIVCSHETTDAYGPKAVQATMGSLARVDIIYTDLCETLRKHHNGTGAKIYGTVLDGENIYAKKLDGCGFLVMGNEGNGISEPLRAQLDERLLIPCFRQGEHAESLNVAIATAIACSEFRRRRAIKKD